MKAMILPDLTAETPFEARDLETPAPGPGEVAIAVKAASLNVVDTKIRDNGRAIAPPAPYILGCDMAGVVTSVGPGVTAFDVGSEVYGCIGGVGPKSGTYAEAIVAEADLLAPKPPSLSFREAAALPLVAITAWEALVDRAQVTPGDHVLVHGGTGGVGHIGVQLARALGATVHTTVSSDEKSEIAKTLGAHDTINYRDQTVEAYIAAKTGGAGYDVVFDTVGGTNISPSMEALAVAGRLVTIVSLETAPDLSQLHLKNARLDVVFMLIPILTGKGRAAHGEILRRLSNMIEGGLVRPLLDPTEFTLDQVGQAHAHLDSGKAVGKVILDIG